MFAFSMPELIVVLVVALIVFGPGKLPEVGKAVGKSIREFRQSTTESSEEHSNKVIETKRESL